jgi:hypothetical protein
MTLLILDIVFGEADPARLVGAARADPGVPRGYHDLTTGSE